MKFAYLLSSCLKEISGNLSSMESSPLSSSYTTLVQYYNSFINYHLFIYFVTHLQYLQYLQYIYVH